MRKIMVALLLISLSISLMAQEGKKCDKGQYLTVDGRCLHDRTGESFKDDCNTVTCMDANCRIMSETALACGHADDPAPTKALTLGPSTMGSLPYSSSGSTSYLSIFTPPQYPKIWCGKHLIGFLLVKPDGKYYECAAKKHQKK